MDLDRIANVCKGKWRDLRYRAHRRASDRKRHRPHDKYRAAPPSDTAQRLRFIPRRQRTSQSPSSHREAAKRIAHWRPSP
jgi:hypothetical protein